MEKSSVQSSESSEKSSEKILHLMEDNPTITAQGIASSLGLTLKGIEKNIRRLRESGMIRRVGPDNGGHWEVLKNDE